MKNMKKFLSALLALSMMLSMGSFALANDGEGGVENELFKEDFKIDGITTFPRLITVDETINGWKRNSSNGDKINFYLDKEDENIFLKYDNPTSYGNQREIAKNQALTAGKNYRVNMKFKYPSGATNVFGLAILGKDLSFRPNVQGFYPGDADQFNKTHGKIAIYPDVWNNVEILLLSKEDADYYEYYLEGKLISSGVFPTRMTDTTRVQLRQRANNGGVAYNTSGYVLMDDIRIAEVDEKRICELAAERTTVPSAVTGNLTLPAEGFGGATISWSSSNTSLIANDGTVTRPENGEIQNVTLTAAITYAATSVTFPYTVKVLPASVYYYEDFEGAKTGPLTSYDSWTGSHSSGNAYDKVFESNIVQQTLTNKSMEIKRAKLPDAGTSGSSFYAVGKTLADAPSDGIISVRMNLYYDNFVWPCVTLSDGTNSQSFMFRTNWSTIYNPAAGTNYVSSVQMLKGTNHNIEFRVDTARGEIELIFNGRSILTTTTQIKTVSNLSFYENRTGLNGSESTTEIFYIDNIVAELIDVPFAYSTIDFAFKGADGNPCIYPEAGGSVSSVIVKKHKSAEKSVLIAAVYENGDLLEAATPIDISSALLNSETAYPVNLPIRSENTQVRAFILAADRIAPLALDKTYVKRSPLTVFVAGDSMAENVSGSTSSKVVDGETVIYSREGWGMRIGEQFADGTISVSNRALGGRDTAEFISEGRLSSILASGQRGDFVLVSFGHNDQGSGISTDTYKTNLKEYSAAIKEKGMIPIFITPITRISTTAEDTDTLTPDANLKLYAEAMKEAASETGDVCLDLYTAFNNFLADKQYSEIRTFFVPKNIDGTHLSPAGAAKAAELIAELLGASGSTLKDLLN